MLKFLRSPLLILGLLSSFSLASLFVAPTASAVVVSGFCATSAGQATEYCKEQLAAQNGPNPAVHVIKLIINIVSFIAGAAAIISLIVSGLKMSLANGDANAVTSARNGILYSLIGIEVIVLAQAIVVFVLDKVK